VAPAVGRSCAAPVATVVQVRPQTLPHFLYCPNPGRSILPPAPANAPPFAASSHLAGCRGPHPRANSGKKWTGQAEPDGATKSSSASPSEATWGSGASSTPRVGAIFTSRGAGAVVLPNILPNRLIVSIT
jgi:hypothetical protein